MEYKASLSHGDPIMLVATFEVPTMAERHRRKQALEDQLSALERGEDVDVESLATPQEASAGSKELLNELNERLQREGADSSFELPSAPDLDKLSDAESKQD